MYMYYEDLTVGKEFLTPGRTVTETDVVLFASITGDNNPQHTDEHFCRQSIFGTRIAHGLLSLSIAQGLFQRLGLTSSHALAYMGISNCRFTAPVKLGDTVYCKAKVLDKKESKKPDRGPVVFELLLYNERDELVLSSEHMILIQKRGST